MQRFLSSGALFLILSTMGFAFFPVFVVNLTDTLPPLDLATIRFTLAGVVMWGVVLRRGSSSVDAAPRREPALQMVATGVLIFIAGITGMRGLQLIPASVYIMLFYSYPAMVAIINAFRGERLGLLSWVALALTVIGIALTTPNLNEGLNVSSEAASQNIEGVVMALLNAAAIALFFLFSSHLMKGQDSIRAATWSMTGAIIAGLVLIPFRGGLVLPQDGETWLWLIGFVIIVTVLPLLLQSRGIQLLGASRAAIISTLEPVFTVMLSILLLNESLVPAQLLGGVFILGAVLLLQWQPAKEKLV